MLHDILNNRLEQIGLSRYELSKRIAESRNPPKKVTDMSSMITRVLDEPEGRRWSNVQEVVEAMGGEIVIRWHDEKSLTPNREPDSNS